MAKRKSSKKKTPGFAARIMASAAAWLDWRALRRATIALTWLIAAVAAVAGWIVGVPRLEARVSQFAVDQAQPCKVEFIGAPSWVKKDLKATLSDIVRMHVSPDPLMQQDLINARNALLDTGCFESVAQVRRSGTHAVTVEAAFLEPYAVVKSNGRTLLIDSKGRLLPPSYRVSEHAHFITITGVHYSPPGRAAQQWEGTDITAALRLIALLQPQAWSGQIDTIDLTGFMQGRPIRLITDHGSALIWESAPNEERAGEVSAAEKIRRMQFLFDSRGHIDSGV